MDSRTQPTALKCVDCDFTCSAGNEMCRHIFSTRHGARKCPKCDAYIVPRAFFASLQKLIERRNERRAGDTAGNASWPSSPEQSSPMLTLDTSAFGAAEPLTTIAVSAHEHCAEYPGFRSFEKTDFVIIGAPRDYMSQLALSSEVATSRSNASLPLNSTTEASASAAALQPFRCMDCLNLCPTWTQVTKHIEQTGHTLPLCMKCLQHLKCFGPMRPPQHEINVGHCGFYGVFYTRRDYRCDTQASRWAYNSANLYTGLTTLQYKCVCGISFLHPVHLAEHLRRVHHVTCINDYAVCHCCGLSGTLAQMMTHLQHPCWEREEHRPSPTMVCHSAPVNPLASAAFEIGKINTVAGDDPFGLDSAAAMTHVVEVPGFSASVFLQFRPLLPPLTDDEVPLINEAHSGTASASAGAPKASYVVLYQCRECLFLFTSWDQIVSHIHTTRHCRTFCSVCKSFLPELISYSASEGSSSGGARAPQQQHQHQQQQYASHAHLPGPSSMPASASASVPVRSTTLKEHLEHMRDHGDIIGFPASPETLEVLVDTQAACYAHSLDPPPESFAGPRTLMAYQCSDPQEGCYKVFLHYGDFVAHLLTTGHGTKPMQGVTPQSGKQVVLSVLPTCYPMVTYRAKFTVAQLCEHFGFVQCQYCETAVPRAEEELHAALCVERRRLSAHRY